ncbi:MAG: HNH endonuclease [SAR324 cluster bacterium]|nr:HNH endonuclease [SAR324 cluster bacterium]MCZ6748919.1 HNH endonuclease [SAR324 cluster bacterium]
MSGIPDEMLIDEQDLRRERSRGRELRRSQWWKNKRANGICHYCGGRFPAKTLTMDHVVPLVRGGKSRKSNVVPCCKACNTVKQDLVPSEWQAYLERLSERDSTP